MSAGDRPIRYYWIHLFVLGVLAITAFWVNWLGIVVGVWLIGDALVSRAEY